MLNQKLALGLLLTSPSVLGLPSLNREYDQSINFIDNGVQRFQNTLESIFENVGLGWIKGDHNVGDDNDNQIHQVDEMFIDDIRYKVLKHDQFPNHRIRLSEPSLCDAGVKQVRFKFSFMHLLLIKINK